MNKPSKFALAIAFAAVTASGIAYAQPKTNDNWMNGQNQLVWKNGTNELCWRDAFWTPATGFPGCDGVPVAKPAAPNPMANKVTFNADTFFDFDKSIIKPEGKKLLDQIAAQVQTINLEAIIAVGHTDWIGTAEYNLKLSQRRAEAVALDREAAALDAHDAGRRRPGEDRDAVAAGELPRIERGVVGAERAGRQVRHAAAHLLQRDDVRCRLVPVTAEAAAQRRADAVDVVGSDADHRAISTVATGQGSVVRRP